MSTRKSTPHSGRSISGTSRYPCLNISLRGTFSLTITETMVSVKGMVLPQSRRKPAALSSAEPSHG